MNPKAPGWLTSEFWITTLTQVVALFVAVGWIAAGERDSLGAAITGSVTAAAAFIASALVIVRYIAARFDLKVKWLDADASFELDDDPEPPDVHSRPTLPPAALFFLAALAAWLVAGPASAQQPAPAAPVAKTSLFGWREAIQIEALKGRLDQQQQNNAELRADLARLEALLLAQRAAPPYQAPAPAAAPQVLILAIPQPGGPLQQLPIAGPPLQQLPQQGPPLQQLPIAGPPLQPLPIAGPPLQPLPQQGPPLQVLPIAGGAPQQQLAPPGQARPQAAPPLGELRPQPAPQFMAPADPLPGRPQQFLPTGPPQRFLPAIARR